MKLGSKIVTTALMVTGIINMALADADPISTPATRTMHFVMLVNDSPGHKPIEVVYKIAHKNVGGITVYGAPQRITVGNRARVDYSLENYQLAGLVPIAVNGVNLPGEANEFDTPQRCSITTDAQHPAGILEINFTPGPAGHVQLLKCKVVKGGVYN